MAAVAGWYPDPEGDTTRLRYWDGTQWTNDYTAVPGAGQAQNAAAGATADTTANTQATGATETQAAGSPFGASPTSNMSYEQFEPNQIYPMTSQDRVLRLIAFILNIISCVGACWLIIPLAWMVPMTVYSWGIYKGTRANTTAFGVCTLIFVNLVSGILLLVSNKDVPPAGDPGNNIPQQ